jgi:hypothetical protein
VYRTVVWGRRTGQLAAHPSMGILLEVEEDATSVRVSHPPLLMEEQSAIDVVCLAGNEGGVL